VGAISAPESLEAERGKVVPRGASRGQADNVHAEPESVVETLHDLELGKHARRGEVAGDEHRRGGGQAPGPARGARAGPRALAAPPASGGGSSSRYPVTPASRGCTAASSSRPVSGT